MNRKFGMTNIELHPLPAVLSQLSPFHILITVSLRTAFITWVHAHKHFFFPKYDLHVQKIIHFFLLFLLIL